MSRSDVINLISETETVNDTGDIVAETTSRQVPVRLKSVGQSEFYQAAAVGLKPEIKFVLTEFADYHNEKKISYQPYGETAPEVYTVLRTYRQGNALELTCVRGVDK